MFWLSQYPSDWSRKQLLDTNQSILDGSLNKYRRCYRASEFNKRYWRTRLVLVQPEPEGS